MYLHTLYIYQLQCSTGAKPNSLFLCPEEKGGLPYSFADSSMKFEDIHIKHNSEICWFVFCISFRIGWGPRKDFSIFRKIFSYIFYNLSNIEKMSACRPVCLSWTRKTLNLAVRWVALKQSHPKWPIEQFEINRSQWWCREMLDGYQVLLLVTNNE